MESHTQRSAFAYPGLNYSALSGLNTLILKHFRTLQSCMRPVSYLSAYGGMSHLESVMSRKSGFSSRRNVMLHS